MRSLLSRLAGFGVAALLVVAAPADAQMLDLTITPGSITMPSGDPDLMPVLISPPVTVSVRVRQIKKDEGWSLTVLANGDLIAGLASVDSSNVTWTATPAPPFQNGTLSRTVAQPLASGTGMENPALNASVTFRLANSWTYIAGTYTQTLVFTLSTP
jgi:hypothetical protein